MWLDRISPRLNTLWRGEWPAHFVEPARYLYDHELVIVSQGKFLLRVEGREWEMGPGSFALIPPDTNHSSHAGREPVFRSCIHFDWLSEARAPRRPICCYFPRRPKSRLVVEKPGFVPLDLVIGTCAREGVIPALVETLFLRWRTGEAFHRTLCRGAFLELLVELFYPPKRRAQQQEAGSQLAYAAKELLDQRSDRGDAGVIDLLKSLGYSYPHVCRLFRRNFGISPLAYLNARRLERAKVLLQNPRLTIAEAAYQSGFQDPGYFTRLFRKQTGMTPVRFRRKER